MQPVGCVPIGVGRVAASLTGEVLAPAPTKTAAARASLAFRNAPVVVKPRTCCTRPFNQSTVGVQSPGFRVDTRSLDTQHLFNRANAKRSTPGLRIGQERRLRARQALGPEASLKGGGRPVRWRCRAKKFGRNRDVGHRSGRRARATNYCGHGRRRIASKGGCTARRKT